MNLYGTGTIDEFSASCSDVYLRPSIKENKELLTMTKELWDFLKDRYGGTEIKRQYIALSHMNKLETKLHQISSVQFFSAS